MAHPAIEVQSTAMSVLGNLLTDVFDPEARRTLELFIAADGLTSLQAKLTLAFLDPLAHKAPRATSA